MYLCMQVTTADGYILSLQRIPRGRGGGAAGGRGGGGASSSRAGQPVLLQHGVLVVRRTHACMHGANTCLFLFSPFVHVLGSAWHQWLNPSMCRCIGAMHFPREVPSAYLLFVAPLLGFSLGPCLGLV
jgi:hypothetical protein